ncbi:hypothetical protein DU478_05380 [Thalassococcus profundi]|uniref:Uncharacterized protein n=1 Tax=Thalassococcus profundi TaxID=2282382 RepID=A0A369TPS6_9RHOB|nr:hypothetical protein [Thalassococcus profundi]RDD67170.1 hypothetical protein DU478_05380 [Thalassococcus profundi]
MPAEHERRFLGVPISIWDGLAGLFTVLAVLGGLIGLILAYFELAQRREAARAEATLALLDVWEGATQGGTHYLNAFRALDARVKANLDEVPQADLDAARADDTMRAALYARVTREVMDDPEAQRAFEDVVYFFQRLAICVETNLCDREATLAFFGGPMRSFSLTFSAPIANRRAAVTDFADGLDLVDTP